MQCLAQSDKAIKLTCAVSRFLDSPRVLMAYRVQTKGASKAKGAVASLDETQQERQYEPQSKQELSSFYTQGQDPTPRFKAKTESPALPRDLALARAEGLPRGDFHGAFVHNAPLARADTPSAKPDTGARTHAPDRGHRPGFARRAGTPSAKLDTLEPRRQMASPRSGKIIINPEP